MNLMDMINKEQVVDRVKFDIGDTVNVHTKIVEGDTERVQVFKGTVIAKSGSGIKENFTVRRVAFGIGVERVFPLNSPRIAKIEVERKGRVRRARLNYLRGKTGKAARIKEKARS